MHWPPFLTVSFFIAKNPLYLKFGYIIQGVLRNINAYFHIILKKLFFGKSTKLESFLSLFCEIQDIISM